mmetsp:Transcript_16531/g.35932  ORF Transcript_16531/g.35932 Transcript_16531/m.35932 type:complete len:302 (-) Transcript_16531:249-1154(-)|eukprot:CAMPEP_0118945372 /NCGR_PEP_ID=MMETSP1169-20130426/42113_1 /TAXON_ID=36882 /ORGANISM="Pyramimonas obovata, Strain CCMP722" /LENGTH=301 /DNA_ID=CAMNT_0006891065 /DNA_START=348 /DNA_END=1253 /DNA_ORIENTATION=-
MTERAFEVDLQNLLQTFIEQVGSTCFQEFKKLWIERHFSLIHQGRPPNLGVKEYTQLLYNFSQRFLHEETHDAVRASPFVARHAVLYTLYLLHETQPSDPKVKIYLPQASLQILVQVLSEARARRELQGAAVMRKLLSGHAFFHGAVPLLPPALSQTDPSQLDMQPCFQLQIADAYLKQGQGNLLDVQELDSASRGYAAARHRVLTECSTGADGQSVPTDTPGLFPSTFADELYQVLTAPPPTASSSRARTTRKAHRPRNPKPIPDLNQILASFPPAGGSSSAQQPTEGNLPNAEPTPSGQ